MTRAPREFRAAGRRLCAGRGRRAFTFPELVLGMAVTVLCLAAMFSVMSATAAGWRQQGVTQQTYLPNRQSVVRIQNLVRDAKLIGLVREGSLASNTSDSACVMLWKSDASGGAADRSIEFSEIGLLEHDRATGTLKYYYVSYPASLTAAERAAAETTFTYAALTAGSAPEDFKSLNYVTSRVVAKNVSGATFYANSALGTSSQLPTFEFQIAFARNGTASRVYGSATLRNPDYKPAS